MYKNPIQSLVLVGETFFYHSYNMFSNIILRIVYWKLFFRVYLIATVHDRITVFVTYIWIGRILMTSSYFMTWVLLYIFKIATV